MAGVLILMAFGFGVVYSSFTLFLIHDLGFSNQAAFSLYSTYASWFFTASIIGGFLGGRFGHRECVWIGCLLLFFAYIFFCFSKTLYFAAALMDIGMGFFFPNAMIVVGHTRRKKTDAPSGGKHESQGEYQVESQGESKRLNIAYILLYLSVNTGVFCGGLASGMLGVEDFVQLFFLSAAFIILSLGLFIFAYPRIVFSPDSQSAFQAKEKKNKVRDFFILCFTTLICVFFIGFVLKHEVLSNVCVITLGFFALTILLSLSFSQRFGLSFIERQNLKCFVLIIVGTLFFWALYNLEQSLLVGFFDQWVNKYFLGFFIPSSYLGSFNALCDILIGVLLMTNLRHINKKFRNETRAFFAIFFMGLAYLVLAIGIYFSLSQPVTSISIVWVLVAFFMMAISEMIIGPLSNALAIEYGPRALQGFLIGFTQLTSGVSGTLADYLTRFASFDTSMNRIEILKKFSHAFLIDAALGMSVGLCLLVGYGFFKYFKRL